MGRMHRQRITASTGKHTLTALRKGHFARESLEPPLRPKFAHPPAAQGATGMLIRPRVQSSLPDYMFSCKDASVFSATKIYASSETPPETVALASPTRTPGTRYTTSAESLRCLAAGASSLQGP